MSTEFGPYQITGELGRGAMAVVWRAWDPTLEREVAIKEPLPPQGADERVISEYRERFLREAKAVARLTHPGIVTIHTAQLFDGRPGLVMELVQGELLSARIRRGPVPVAFAVEVIDQLLDAVGYAHERGVIHRDLKPENIFLTPSGRIKIADFGVARMDTADDFTMVGTVLGTPAYMSPEQVKGDPVDARSDLFSVGVIAYVLLTGSNPFKGTGQTGIATVLYRIANEQPASPATLSPEIPEHLASAVMRALSKSPADRPLTAAAMRTEWELRSVPRMPSNMLDAWAYPEPDTHGVATPVSDAATSLPIYPPASEPSLASTEPLLQDEGSGAAAPEPTMLDMPEPTVLELPEPTIMVLPEPEAAPIVPDAPVPPEPVAPRELQPAPPDDSTPKHPTRPRRRMVAIAASLAFLLTLCAAGYALTRERAAEPNEAPRADSVATSSSTESSAIAEVPVAEPKGTRLALSVGDRSITKGKSVKIAATLASRGTDSARLKRQRVAIEWRKKGGTWRRRVVLTNSAGRALHTLKPTSTGTWYVRARFLGTEDFAACGSRPAQVSISVKAVPRATGTGSRGGGGGSGGGGGGSGGGGGGNDGVISNPDG